MTVESTDLSTHHLYHVSNPMVMDVMTQIPHRKDKTLDNNL
jgi:hypothetical protein